MWTWLTARHRKVVGMDIRANAVNAVQLSYHRQQHTIEAMGTEPLPEGVMDGPHILKPAVVTAAIARLLSKHAMVPACVMMAIPDAQVFMRSFQLSELAHSHRFEDALAFDIEKHVPYPLCDLYFDYHVVDSESDDGQGKTVHCAAAPLYAVNTRLQVLADAGCEVKGVDVESLAIARAKQWCKGMAAQGLRAKPLQDVHASLAFGLALRVPT